MASRARSFICAETVKLTFMAVQQVTYQSYIDYFEPSFSRAATHACIFELTLDLCRKLSPKWGGGPIFCSGPSFVGVWYYAIKSMMMGVAKDIVAAQPILPSFSKQQ